MKTKDVKKIDLGCGKNKREGFFGVDMSPDVKPDLVWNLEEYPYPFEDGQIEEIHCSHTIEHLQELMPFMNECHRILKQGGIMSVVAPYYTSVRCWQDPTHIQPISEHTFLYYNKQWRETNGLDHYPITADFDFGYQFAFTPEWINRSDEARRFALIHYNNVVTDIAVTLTKK